jgi:hypothetical protein
MQHDPKPRLTLWPLVVGAVGAAAIAGAIAGAAGGVPGA